MYRKSCNWNIFEICVNILKKERERLVTGTWDREHIQLLVVGSRVVRLVIHWTKVSGHKCGETWEKMGEISTESIYFWSLLELNTGYKGSKSAAIDINYKTLSLWVYCLRFTADELFYSVNELLSWNVSNFKQHNTLELRLSSQNMSTFLCITI